MSHRAAFLAAFLSASLPALADVRLHPLFSESMVLPREHTVIWGTANPGEAVLASIAKTSGTTIAAEDGSWKIHLKGLKPGGPHDLVVTAGNTITLTDVIIGDVWLASGQSNMEWPLSKTSAAAEEISRADHPNVRFYVLRRKTSTEPLPEPEGRWVRCTPETAGGLSGVAYYFATETSATLKIPIGIIQNAYGGTPAEAWTPLEAIRANPNLAIIEPRWARIVAEYPEKKAAFDDALARWEKDAATAKAEQKQPPPRPLPPTDPQGPHAPASLYNALVHPLLPFPIKGVIWYQGEANTGRAPEYFDLLTTMIRSWRNAWGNQTLPFHQVQLAGFMPRKPQPGDSNWALIREAQRRVAQAPHNGLASAIDIGEENDIHPGNKRDVGLRLAALALSKTYGIPKIPAKYPEFESIKIVKNVARVTFKNADGLKDKNGKPLEGFAIAGDDAVFRWADAKLEGKTVALSHPDVPKPVAVRYAWADFPATDLVNAAGLPALPFRTDAWSSTHPIPAPPAPTEPAPAAP